MATETGTLDGTVMVHLLPRWITGDLLAIHHRDGAANGARRGGLEATMARPLAIGTETDDSHLRPIIPITIHIITVGLMGRRCKTTGDESNG